MGDTSETTAQDADTNADNNVPGNPVPGNKVSIDLAKELQTFTSRVSGLKSTLLFTMVMAQKARDMARARRDELLEQHGVVVKEEDEHKTYEVPAANVDAVDEATRTLENLHIGCVTLPKNHLVALVSAYDYFLARLVRWYYLKVPAALESTEKNIGLSELLEFGSISSAKEYFLEREVETLLRKSHTKQFEWLESKLRITLRDGLMIWPEFIEITERRNLFVHVDGHVSRQYLRSCGESGYKFESQPKVGDQLQVPQDYFARAVDVIFCIGVMLGQTVWRKLAPDQLEEADKSLTQITYDLLKRERFERAATILEFGVSLPRHSSDVHRRVIIINQAQCYKWIGDQARCEAVLDEEDWSACSDDFQICQAVLRDEFDRAADLMRDIGDDGCVIEADYKSWPVFREFRKTDSFSVAFRDVFGHDPVEEVDTNASTSDSDNDTALAQDDATS